MIAPHFEKPVKCGQNIRRAYVLCSFAYRSLGLAPQRDEELLSLMIALPPADRAELAEISGVMALDASVLTRHRE